MKMSTKNLVKIEMNFFLLSVKGASTQSITIYLHHIPRYIINVDLKKKFLFLLRKHERDVKLKKRKLLDGNFVTRISCVKFEYDFFFLIFGAFS